MDAELIVFECRLFGDRFFRMYRYHSFNAVSVLSKKKNGFDGILFYWVM